MPRFQSHFAAALAAIVITLVSVQTVVTVPSAQMAVVSAPLIA